MQLLILIISGLIENLGYLLVGPILANYLGLISLEVSLYKLLGDGLNWKEILQSSYLMPGLLITIYSFRALHLIQLQNMCKTRIHQLMRRLKKSIYYLIQSEQLVSSASISKYLLSDISTSVYSYYYHKLVVFSCVIPFLIMSSYCIYVLGIQASLVLSVWLLVLFFFVSKLIKASGKIGVDLNENNIQRFEQTSEFISIAKLSVIYRMFEARWESLMGANRNFADNQYRLQITSASPKLLVEVFLIFGLLILYYFYKSQGGSPSEFLAVITMASASLYRLMPLGINLVTSVMQMSSSKDQHNSLKNLLARKSEQTDYIKTSNDIKIKGDELFVKGRLGTETNKLSFEITEFGLYGFIGKSGSGKSTLSDVISGIRNPTSGTLHIHHSCFDSSGNLNVGRSFQDPVIIKGTLRENISFFREEVVDPQKIVFLGLDHLDSARQLGKDQAGASLSGGEGKRIDILRTLASDSKLLIFDEPEAGLDLKTKLKMIELLREDSANKTILVFSHDSDVVSACKKVFNLESSS